MADRTFPLINFKQLCKGQKLETGYLQSVFGCEYGSDPYRNKVRSLLGEIKKYRPDLYPRTSRGAVLIMEDTEAVQYNSDRIDTLMGTTLNTIRDQGRIDRNQLPDAQKRSFDNHLQVTGAVALQLASDREKLKLTKLLKS